MKSPINDPRRSGLELTAQATLRSTALRVARCLEQMDANAPGVIAGRDPEALHQFRVNLRRARSLMEALEPALMPDQWHPLRRQLGVLNRLAGTVRDLDVIGKALPTLAARASSGRKSVQRELTRTHARTHAEAHAALARFLHKSRYRTLMDDWRALLAGIERLDPEVVNSEALPQLATVPMRIDLMYRRARRLGHMAMHTRARHDLHATRKAIKRLRYLVEAFESELPEGVAGNLGAQTAALQKALGRFCDLELERDFVALALADSKARCKPLRERIELDIDAQVGRCLARLADFEAPGMGREVASLTPATRATTH